MKPERATLFNSINGTTNIFCRFDDLSNEASVESFFVFRLLKDLGYKDSQIKPKKSLSLLTVSHGRRKEKYKPDYALVVNRVPQLIVDAKGTNEDVDDYIEQCSGYCLALNRKYKEGNPVRYFILSNGLTTKLYQWDNDSPLLILTFSDFELGNPNYQKLKWVVAADRVSLTAPLSEEPTVANFPFRRTSSERARFLFKSCHDVIWKTEGKHPPAAFMDFLKIMFVKLWADRKLRKDTATAHLFKTDKDVVNLPASAVLFSEDWIKGRESESLNPLDSILFRRLRDEIEQEIQLRKKKRIFDKDERINLKPETIKNVVRRLEHYDLFGIDEDLNGRLFETFLSATMRGRGLGQYFTPRSVVKMMTVIAGLTTTKKKQTKVLDACCGSGGFLIEALTIMRNQLRENRSLSEEDFQYLYDIVANECLYGIDFGKEPPLARIARINMYLHGDGGSRIYYADSLDKQLILDKTLDPEIIRDQEELRGEIAKADFDIVLTNPPFSMTKKEDNLEEKRILEEYKLARKNYTSSAIRPSLRSSVMFIERYHDLLKKGGLLCIVLDDTLLASDVDVFRETRRFIRDNFIIKAIISLPGDAFRRAGSRVKTSVLVLEKKQRGSDVQPNCYGYFATKLGLDDLTPRASELDIQEARRGAGIEAETIISEYRAFTEGKSVPLILTPDRLLDRLDLKYCVPEFGRMAAAWRKSGAEVKRLVEVVKPIEDMIYPQEHKDEVFTLIKVNYEGRCEAEHIKKGGRIKAKKMFRIRKGQLVFSTIRATDGAMGVVPEEYDGALVSGSYTVFECSTPEDTAYLWAILRSYEIRADMQSQSPGSGRYTTYWPEVGNLLIPWLSEDKRKVIGRGLLDAWENEKKMLAAKKRIMEQIAELGVESEKSKQRFKNSKAPT